MTPPFVFLPPQMRLDRPFESARRGRRPGYANILTLDCKILHFASGRKMTQMRYPFWSAQMGRLLLTWLLFRWPAVWRDRRKKMQPGEKWKSYRQFMCNPTGIDAAPHTHGQRSARWWAVWGCQRLPWFGLKSFFFDSGEGAGDFVRPVGEVVGCGTCTASNNMACCVPMPFVFSLRPLLVRCPTTEQLDQRFWST